MDHGEALYSFQEQQVDEQRYQLHQVRFLVSAALLAAVLMSTASAVSCRLHIKRVFPDMPGSGYAV